MLNNTNLLDELACAGKMPVAERFVSINGEGAAAGQLAAFIRFAGCNLNCSYCDTAWANTENAVETAKAYTVDELVQWIKAASVCCVTLTGGEPVLQPLLPNLVKRLASEIGANLRIEIETNGSVDLKPLCVLRDTLDANITFTVDWKLGSSGEEGRMSRQNFALLDGRDAVKFVCGTKEDLQEMLSVVEQLALKDRVNIFLSTVFGKFEPAEIVEFMKANNINWARIQLQMHKIIWPNKIKGV